MLVVPVWVVFLTAPPIWVFRHDEKPVSRTGMQLALELIDVKGATTGYRLYVENHGEDEARNFSIRILLPRDLSPHGHTVQPLSRVIVGRVGSHWFTETIQDDSALTFRAHGRGAAPVTIGPGDRVAIAELRFASGRVRAAPAIDFQISGGTVHTVLGHLTVPISDHTIDSGEHPQSVT